MPIVTVTEAIALSGKSSSTVFRDLRSGRLSRAADGSRGIDTTELLRVYKTLQDTTKEAATPLKPESDAMSRDYDWLKDQFAKLQDENKELKVEVKSSQERERAGAERERQQSRQFMALLEHKSESLGDKFDRFTKLFK